MKVQTGKLAPRGRRGAFLGVDGSQVVVLDSSSKRLVYTRNVEFFYAPMSEALAAQASQLTTRLQPVGENQQPQRAENQAAVGDAADAGDDGARAAADAIGEHDTAVVEQQATDEPKQQRQHRSVRWQDEVKQETAVKRRSPRLAAKEASELEVIDCSNTFHHVPLPTTEPEAQTEVIEQKKEPGNDQSVTPQFKVERKIEGTREQPIISYQRVRVPPLRADAVDFVSAHS